MADANRTGLSMVELIQVELIQVGLSLAHCWDVPGPLLGCIRPTVPSSRRHRLGEPPACLDQP